MTQIAPRWSPDLDAILTAGLAEHKTLAQIALLTGRTRNSCCGRAARLREKAGIVVKRPIVEGEKPKPRNGHIDSALHYKIRRLMANEGPPRLPSESLAPMTARFEEGFHGQIGRLGLMELREGVCRFPIVQPKGPCRYCGDTVAERSVYCGHHSERVRQQ